MAMILRPFVVDRQERLAGFSIISPMYAALLIMLALTGCGHDQNPQSGNEAAGAGILSLVEARHNFHTKLVPDRAAREPVPEPPARVFRKVQYDSSVGKLAAYLTPDPKDSKKHPAIIWITGGDCNSIGEVWENAPPDNEQTASAYRKAGIIMMFPALRGGNDGPGTKEGFLGEVDDVIAAGDFLRKLAYIDPSRIYLGGHSTGGTLVLLVAECSDRFRAIFSFGPVDNVAGYGPEYLPFDTSNQQEIELRSPGKWLTSIKNPTFVFEGSQGNIQSLQAMARSSANPNAHFMQVRQATHFTILAPTNILIAQKILRDEGPTCNLRLTEEEVNKQFAR